MGADGGINWIQVSNIAQFTTLVQPFGLLWDHSDYYDDTRHEYLEKYPLPNDCVVSQYGTNLTRNGMEELVEIVRFLINYREDALSKKEMFWLYGAQDMLALTWEEILLNWLTSPNGGKESGYLPCPVSLIMWEEFTVCGQIRSKKLEDNTHILRMTLREWLEKIEPIISLGSWGSAETWS